MLERLSECLFGGTRGFNAAEARLLSLLSEALPAQERQTLARQLGAVRKVQRQNPGRLVVALMAVAAGMLMTALSRRRMRSPD